MCVYTVKCIIEAPPTSGCTMYRNLVASLDFNLCLLRKEIHGRSRDVTPVTREGTEDGTDGTSAVTSAATSDATSDATSAVIGGTNGAASTPAVGRVRGSAWWAGKQQRWL